MNFTQIAATALVLVALQVVIALPQYRVASPQRHWYMFNRNNPAVDPRTAAIYGGSAYRGGLAEELPPLQRSALTDFLARYFPRLFGPTVAAADPAESSLPPGASIVPYETLAAAGLSSSSLSAGAASGLTYDLYPSNNINHNIHNVPAHSAYHSYNYPRPIVSGNRGSYQSYPGRGHEFPPGLVYPLIPYEGGYKKVVS